MSSGEAESNQTNEQAQRLANELVGDATKGLGDHSFFLAQTLANCVPYDSSSQSLFTAINTDLKNMPLPAAFEGAHLQLVKNNGIEAVEGSENKQSGTAAAELLQANHYDANYKPNM